MAPGRYGEGWLWAGEVELAVLRRLCCLCAHRARIQSLVASLGLCPSSWDTGAGLALIVLWSLGLNWGLSCGLLT